MKQFVFPKLNRISVENSVEFLCPVGGGVYPIILALEVLASRQLECRNLAIASLSR